MVTPRFVLALLAGIGVLALLIAVAAGFYLAYDQQTSEIEELEEMTEQQASEISDLESVNRRILQDHAAIGKTLQNITNPAGLPEKLAPLKPFADRGFLVPRSLPDALANDEVAIGKYKGGYSLTWLSGLTFFASSRDTLSEWTGRASSGSGRRVTVGKRKVIRLAGSSIVYAWRARERTYALIASPPRDRVARRLIAAMK